jgi:hypothetical protein
MAGAATVLEPVAFAEEISELVERSMVRLVMSH